MTCKSILTSILGFGGLFPVATAAPINIAFHNGATTVGAMATRPDGSLVMTSVDTWNNPARNGAGGLGLAFTDFALDDATGTSSGALLAVTSGFTTFNNNGWGSQSQDHVMMEAWYGFRDAESLTVTSLPSSFTAGGYAVFVYGDVNGVRTMDYVIDGVQKTIEDTGPFAGTFLNEINFVVFEGLTGDNFTLTGNTVSAGRSAINGLRIVPTAELPLTILDFSTPTPSAADGSMVTLNWQTLGASGLTLQPGNVELTGLTSTTVTISGNTTYTLSATDGTETIEASVDVFTQPIVNLFEALPKTARDSADVRLVWNITSGDSLTISDGNSDVFTSSDLAEIASGFTIINGVSADTTFTLTTSLLSGTAVTATSSVDIRTGSDPVSFEETVLSDSPLAYYRFEESSAVQLLDHSSNDNDSVNLSASGLIGAQAGAVGSSWRFDEGSVLLPINLDPSTGSFSIALLAKHDSGPTGPTDSLVSQQNGTGSGRSLIQKSVFDGQYSSWLAGARTPLVSVPPSNSWCHLVFVYDLVGEQLRFYLNGELVDTETGAIALATDGNYVLGANKGRTTEFLRGFLDEVAIFDYALDDLNNDGDLADSRVADHYAAFLRDAAPLLGFSESVSIPTGSSVDLSWKVGDAATSIVIDNGVGDVTSQTSNGGGRITVTPTQTTTYTITVNGTETREVTITVTAELEITDCGFDENGDFLVTCRNLVPGRDYSLALASELENFVPIGDPITAGETGVFTFSDSPVAGEFSLYYRVEEVEAP